VLIPIEKPNILPSIDTLDEQKTDKKPKDKKKKKKKKKDEELRSHVKAVHKRKFIEKNVFFLFGSIHAKMH
jgi:hypothetical protein